MGSRETYPKWKVLRGGVKEGPKCLHRPVCTAREGGNRAGAMLALDGEGARGTRDRTEPPARSWVLMNVLMNVGVFDDACYSLPG